MTTHARTALTLLVLLSNSATAAEVKEKEPNNSFKNAQEISVGDTYWFTFKEKGDFDFLKITSPGDGVIRIIQPKQSKTHQWVHPWWLANEKQYYGDGVWGSAATKDQVLTFAIRSARHSWDYKASDEVISIKVVFEPAAVKEPDNSVKEALPIKIGEPFKVQFNPRYDRDYRTFTSPDDGFVALSLLTKKNAHKGPHPWWMADEKTATRDGVWSQRVSKDEKVTFGLRSAKHGWDERGNDEVLEMKATFYKELSTHEPNDTFAQAKEVKIDEEVTLMMAPQYDRDFYKVVAPADGILTINQLAKPAKAHNLYPWWPVNAKQYMRDGMYDREVKKGETVYFALRSAKHSWDERYHLEPYKIKVTFYKHALDLPINNSYASACPVKVGEPFVAQIAPRYDRDYFKVKAPGAGTLKLRQISKPKAHGGSLYPGWMKDPKHYHREGQWDRSVAAGETVIFYLRSAKHSWDERSSQEQIKLLLSYTPEDPGAEPNNTMQQAKAIELDRPFTFQLNPRGDRDYFKVKAPMAGVLKLTRIDKSKSHPNLQLWWGEDGDRNTIAPQVMERRLAKGETAVFAFRSAWHSWDEFGSDVQLQFKAELTPESDSNEPNDVAADATLIEVGKPFSYQMLPSDDYDYFLISAPADGVLLVRNRENKPIPNHTRWLEIGDSEWGSGQWIEVKKGKKYLLMILGINTGYGKRKSIEAVVHSGTAKEFNLIPPTPRKRWSFDIKQDQ